MQKNPNYETNAEQLLRLGFHFQTMPRVTHTSLWLIRLIGAVSAKYKSQAGLPQ